MSDKLPVVARRTRTSMPRTAAAGVAGWHVSRALRSLAVDASIGQETAAID